VRGRPTSVPDLHMSLVDMHMRYGTSFVNVLRIIDNIYIY